MTKKEQEFVKTVRNFYRRHGRSGLPWRKTRDPYKILVSEVMLQQTQVARVVPKYKSFLKRFPTVEALAEAPLSEVLREWQGLGYNRRAKLLHESAKEIAKGGTCFGTCQSTCHELQKLPGVGPYTAAALMAFVYNQPVPLLETNVRTVYLHHFFKNTSGITDKDILRMVERTMNTENIRAWYFALMDYGAHLKSSGVRLNAQSKHYSKQSKFEGSDRQIRGAIVRTLAAGGRTKQRLVKELDFAVERVQTQLEKLLAEGMVAYHNQQYRLP